MADNVTQPLYPDRLHFPRNELAELILSGFERRVQTATTIFAPRRKGKTTFLQNDLIPMAKERGFVVAMADLWLDRKHPEHVIAKALAEGIYQSGFFHRTKAKLMRPGQALKSVSMEVSAEASGVKGGVKGELADSAALPLAELFERFRIVGEGRALLIIDEVQHLATSDDFEDFTATLRSLLQACQGEVFAVFTGSSQDGLARMFRRTKAPFYQYGSEVGFPELGRDFAEHFGALYHEVTGRQWETDKAFELYIARGMMPQYLRNLYIQATTQNLAVNEADKIVWRSMLDEGQFTGLLAEMPPLDVLVLRGILTGESLYAEEYRTRLADEMPSGTRPTTSMVQAALKRLHNKDLVGNLEHGSWKIEDSALESYLRRTLIDDETNERSHL